MKKRILRYFKHIILTILIGLPTLIAIGFLTGQSLKHSRDNNVSNWNNEGPHVFFKNDSTLDINYVQGNRENGFSVSSSEIPVDSIVHLTCYYPLDSSSFSFELKSTFDFPETVYNDQNKILAISDIESNYGTFRDFLINNKVIDKDLNWIFGKNHLVLDGDFIDRSYFSTQVLWFIYKLEQDAKANGGHVHYILGNHEIMNMQGNHSYAKSKYRRVAAMLDKKQFELYGTDAVLGRWMASKNTLEVINGNLFVHGGISPELAKTSFDINQINRLARENYYQPYYPKANGDKELEILLSSETSPYWYRGYYQADLTQEEIELGLDKFKANAVIVGHTVQTEVNRKFEGKVIGIDVKHPQDYYEYFPSRQSEGLLIEGGKYFRIFENGEKEELD